MVDYPPMKFLTRPQTKKDKFFRWVKRRLTKIIGYSMAAIIGVLVFMYQTIWKYEWEFEKTRIENLKSLYEEIEYNKIELEALKNSVLKIKGFIDNPKYINLSKQDYQNLPEIFQTKNIEKFVGDVELKIPKMKDDVIDKMDEKGITPEMLNPQNKHFLYGYDKSKYTNMYGELMVLIEDFNNVYLDIDEYKKVFLFKLGDLEFKRQGMELKNKLEQIRKKVSHIHTDVNDDYTTLSNITNELDEYLKR